MNEKSKNMKKQTHKPAPQIKSDEEAGKFWLEHDSTDYIDWSKAERPNRGKTYVRLSEKTAQKLKRLAEKKSLELSTLAEQYVLEGIRQDSSSHTRKEA